MKTALAMMKTALALLLLAAAFTTAHAATTQPGAMINIDGHPVLIDDIMQVLSSAPSRRQHLPRVDMTVDTAARDPSAPASAPPANCPLVPEPVPLQRPLPKAFADFLGMLQGKIEASVDGNPAVPSVAAALHYRGDALFETYYGNKTMDGRGGADPPTADTIYGIGSVTKVFPVIQLFMLFERGVIASLDDPVSKYAQGFRVVNPYGDGQPTLFELATQLSGLPREAPCPGPLMACGNATHPTPQATMLARLRRTLLIRDTNAYPSYSNLAYALLAHTLTLAADPTGKTTFDAWVRTNILDPLGMASTGMFEYSDAVKARMATGYIGTAPQPAGSAADIGWVGPCGSAYSTVGDLSKLALALMRGTLFERRALGRELLQPVFYNHGGGTLFGAPWEMWVDRATGTLVRRKGGNLGGFASLLAFVPELELSLTMTWNNMGVDEFGASDQGFSALLPPFVALLATLQPDFAPLPPRAAWGRYLGRYRSPVLGWGNVTAQELPVRGNPNNTVPVLFLQVPALTAGIFLKSAPASLGPGYLQMYLPNAMLPCLANELAALNDGYVRFYGGGKEDGGGRDGAAPSVAYTFLGNAQGVNMTRVE